MRTPEQILNKISEEKKTIEVLIGQLYQHETDIYLYRDALNFMAEAARSLDNAEEELRDIILK